MSWQGTQARTFVRQWLLDTYGAFKLNPHGLYADKCRKIDCIHKPCDYSQHTFFNAIDLTWNTSNWDEDAGKAILDGIKADLTKDMMDQLGIRLVLWRTLHHDNHMHLDFWPHGEGKPTCAGESHPAYRYRDGSYYYGTDPPMESTGVISDPNELPLYPGDQSDLVAYYQARMLLWDPLALPRYGADGDFGAETERWVRIFQGRFGIPVTGIIDELLAALLRDDPPPVIIVPPPPPVEIPEPEPLPEFQVGMGGAYKRFYTPIRGRYEPWAKRANETALEDFLAHQNEDLQGQIDHIANYLREISGGYH